LGISQEADTEELFFGGRGMKAYLDDASDLYALAFRLEDSVYWEFSPMKWGWVPTGRLCPEETRECMPMGSREREAVEELLDFFLAQGK
jgi:hypothetical protein